MSKGKERDGREREGMGVGEKRKGMGERRWGVYGGRRNLEIGN